MRAVTKRRSGPVGVLLVGCLATYGCDPQSMSSGETGGTHGTDSSGNESGGHDTEVMANCEMEDRADDFKIGTTKEGAEVIVSIADAMPAEPIRGENGWTLTIQDADATMIEGAELSVLPWMPDHGHGSPVQPEITEEGGGDYHVEPLDLFMAGLWEVTFELTLDDGTTDEVMFAVCVE